MAVPIEVNFHNVDRSEALADVIVRRALHLKSLHSGLSACRVSVVASQRRNHRIKALSVLVDLSVSGRGLVASCRTEADTTPDAYATVNEAFERAARQLCKRKGQLIRSRIGV